MRAALRSLATSAASSGVIGCSERHSARSWSAAAVGARSFIASRHARSATAARCCAGARPARGTAGTARRGGGAARARLRRVARRRRQRLDAQAQQAVRRRPRDALASEQLVARVKLGDAALVLALGVGDRRAARRRLRAARRAVAHDAQAHRARREQIGRQQHGRLARAAAEVEQHEQRRAAALDAAEAERWILALLSRAQFQRAQRRVAFNKQLAAQPDALGGEPAAPLEGRERGGGERGEWA